MRAAASLITLLPTPHGGIQPQAVTDARGIHLVYLKGEPGAADVYYTRRTRGHDTWSSPIRVNSVPGSAVAIGTIRGAHVALGRGGRVHVVWFGSDRAARAPAGGAPLLYTRMNAAGTGFEPERSLSGETKFLDGGPSVAADRRGNVYVAWHAATRAGMSEADRRLWVARSTDGGRSFGREAAAWDEPTGACACCGARAFVDGRGVLRVLYRAATRETERDMILLASANEGRRFTGRRVHPWKISTCPMSSESFAEGASGLFAAWETKGEVFFARIDPGTGCPGTPVSPPGGRGDRKHPTVAVDASGKVLLAWTEGTGWQKGGSLAWQVFEADGRATGIAGRRDGAIPVWGLATATTRSEGGFWLIH